MHLCLAQISTATEVFILDFKRITALPQQFVRILGERRILKVGTGFQNDGKVLFEALGLTIRSFVDVGWLTRLAFPERYATHIGPLSLEVMVHDILGHDLDKSLQTSNWATKYQANDQQIQYAGLDAQASREIYAALLLPVREKEQSINRLIRDDWFIFDFVDGEARTYASGKAIALAVPHDSFLMSQQIWVQMSGNANNPSVVNQNMETPLPAVDPNNVESKVFNLLTSYDLPPHEFLDSLDETRSLVSGSAALWPLLDWEFYPNDVDIYSPEDTAAAMLDILRHRFRFTIIRMQITQAQTSAEYPDYLGVRRVYWLKRRHHTLNFIVVDGGNAAATIFNFHSTIVMNYFSGTRLYCSMPELTLRKISAPNINLIDVSVDCACRTIGCIYKYHLRGITFRYGRHIAVHVCGSDPICPATLRTLHDNAGLVIPFPSRVGVVQTADVYDGIRSVRWSLGGPHCYAPNISYVTILERIEVPRHDEDADTEYTSRTNLLN
ncbi:hypothetical protein B0H16DRAFT_1740966 [Mycena metata]|uniref:3'-5' exonuclease domain-containing protein n=1 Tax=Mycena metata TaxID=1033252 RepID=A0AAD7HCD3_9AGAR|nr:hypothetical protein B0H16DRAFT_1740966 [Mycena metata]